jgi:hypothetical protein
METAMPSKSGTTRRSRLRAVTAIAVVAAMVAMGCSEEDRQKDAYADAFSVALREDQTLPLGREEARCLAERIVAIVGADALDDAGISPDDIESGSATAGFAAARALLDEEQAAEVTDAFFDGECIDVGRLFAQSIQDSGLDLSDAQTTCLGRTIVENDAFKQAVVDQVLGAGTTDSPNIELDELDAILERCEISLDDFD